MDRRINKQRSNTSQHLPIVEARTFYEYVASGDIEAILHLRRKFGGRSADDPQTLIEKEKLSENPLHSEIYHFVVNCTIITRCCIAAGMPQEEALTLSNLFIRRADRCNSITDVHGVNDEMALEFASRMQRIRRGAPASYAVHHAITFIENNLHSRITVSQIASEVGYNRSHLAVLFKQETGQTLSEYILAKKLEAAQSMIISGGHLSDIAHSLGFCSQSHFCKAFKKAFGVSPKQFRADN